MIFPIPSERVGNHYKELSDKKKKIAPSEILKTEKSVGKVMNVLNHTICWYLFRMSFFTLFRYDKLKIPPYKIKLITCI